MKGFILYPSYKIIDGKSYVFLFGKLENGESFLAMSFYEPYFYIKTRDAKKAGDGDFKIENSDFKNFKDERLSRVILETPKNVPSLRRSFEEDGIECYEADIRFAYRYLMDKGIMMSVEIDGDYETSDFINRIYKDAEIKPAEYFPNNLKMFSVDIETSFDGKKLYSVAIYSEKFEKVLIDMDEEDILEEFKKIILEEDPDIITGWNLIDFDLVFLKNKFKEYKIPFVLGRTNEPCKIKIESDFFRDSKADFPGRVVLDGIQLLRMSFVSLDSYKLEDAAQTILKEGKLISYTEGKGEEIDRLFREDKKKLAKYNLNDARLVSEILKKTKIIEMTIERSILTGMPLDRVNASIASLDSLYLRELRNRNYVANSGHYSPKDERIKGGYVMESKPGIYDYLLVLDFKSLYPSLMRTFNIDPFSYVENGKGKNLIKAPNGAHFKNQDGIMGVLVERLLKARDKAKKEKNELQRHAIKILLNSMFGVLANPNCRFFSLDVANAITHFGQKIIKLTAEKVEEEGYEVIYSDTDSVFILSKADNVKEAENIGKELSINLNKFFDEYTKKEYKRDNYMEVEYEKCFVRFLMPRVRGSETGAKKRYAGLNSKDEIEIIGMETVRCFVPGNIVPTTSGFKKINHLNINDKLIGFDTYSRQIHTTTPNNIFKYDYDDKIINLTVEGKHKFKVTPDHEFFVLIPSKKISRLDRGFCKYRAGNVITKYASELESGDYLLSIKKIPCSEEISLDKKEDLLARFFGYFVGEGRLYERYKERGLHQRRLEFTFGADEKEIIEDCKNTCKKILGKNMLSYKKGSRYRLYTDLSKNIFEPMKENFVLNKANDNYIRTLALTHKVPEFILNGNKEVICSFLNSYFDSEGTVDKKIIVSTISKNLFYGVCYLLRKLGLQYNYSSMSPNPKHNTVHRKYVIEIGLNGFEQFSKDIGFKLKYKQKKLLNGMKSRNIKRARYIRSFTDNLILRKITNINEENYVGEVYDIEVDSRNSNYFIDYILTHNSDWTELAKKFQMELLDRLFHKKEVKSYIKKLIDEVKNGKHDDWLVYRKQIRKDLKEYKKITPQHVRAARLLKNFKGSVIEYVLTEDGPEPVEQIKHKLDYKHYIDKQIKPIANAVLIFFDITLDELLEGSTQVDLNSFSK